MKQMHNKERERLERERELLKEKERQKELELQPVIKQEILDVSTMLCVIAIGIMREVASKRST